MDPKIENGGLEKAPELHMLYHSPIIVRAIKSRRLKWVHIASMKEIRSAFKILTGKPERWIPLGWPRLRWEDNNRMNLKGIYINTWNWVDSARDEDYWKPLKNVALNCRMPWS